MDNLPSTGNFDSVAPVALEEHTTNIDQIVEQENDAKAITQNNANGSEALKVEISVKRFDSDAETQSVSPDTQSNLSPIKLNFLVEVASPSLLKTTLDPSEESHSFTSGQACSKVIDGSNINNKISEILIKPRIQLELIDPPEQIAVVRPPLLNLDFDAPAPAPPLLNLDYVAPPPLLNLNFSLGSGLGLEVPEPTEEQAQPAQQFRRKRKSKNPSRVTFDDSLNIDIIYDPDVPSIQYIKMEKSSETTKKPEFISVYSTLQTKSEEEGEEEEGENRDQTSSQKERRHDVSLEYRVEITQTEDMETEQNPGLFDGVSNSSNDQSELRLSKMTEDQAARIFEARKHDIFEGLKKLNKNRPYNSLPKSPQTQVLSNRRPLGSKGDSRKALSRSYDENQLQPRVTGLIVENIANKRPKSSQRSERKSVTPQKVSKLLGESDSDKKNEQTKTFTIDLNKRGRATSQQMIKTPEPEVLNVQVNDQNPKDGKMIEEIYKQAKADVQKRIASIEKTLVETHGSDSARKVLERKNDVIQPQLNKPSSYANVLVSPKQNYRKSPELGRKLERLTPEPLQLQPQYEKKKLVPTNQIKKEELQTKLVPTKPKTSVLDSEASERQRIKNNSFSVPSVNKQKSEKNEQVGSSSKYISTLESQQLPVSKNTITTRSSQKIYLEYDNRPSNARLSTPKKAMNSPPKFAEIEAVVSQRNSYSYMHHEKSKSMFTNPKTQANSSAKKSEADSTADVVKPYTDIKKSLYTSTFNKLSNKQTQEAQNERYRTPVKNEETKLEERLEREDKEVKQYTLRPQSTEKGSHKKTNSNILSSNKYSNITAENDLLKAENPIKSPLQAEIEKYLNLVTTTPKDKIPRSISASNMKGFKPNASPKLQPSSQSRKLQTYELFSGVQMASPKVLKPTAYALSPGRPTDSNRNEKSNRVMMTPTRPSNQSPAFDSSRTGSPKSEYLKSLFYSQKNTSQNKDNSKSQKSGLSKSNFSSGTNDNLEEASSKNYKFLEIRNNQYVFLNQ